MTRVRHRRTWNRRVFRAAAVSGVTGGIAVLESVLIHPDEGDSPGCQLRPRRVGGDAPPSGLGVYRISPSGYPIPHWPARHAWRAIPDRQRESFAGVAELEEHFRRMVATPESRLVTLFSFTDERGPASGGFSP